MQIVDWNGTIEFKCREGTDTGRQSFKVVGGECGREELPAKVAAALESMMLLLGDRSKDAQTAEIDALKAELEKAVLLRDKAEKQSKMLIEANEAEVEKAKADAKAEANLPPSEPAPKLSEGDDKPPKRGRGRPKKS